MGNMSTDGPFDRPEGDPDRPPEDRPAREPADSQVPQPDEAETRSRQEYFEAINSASSQEAISFEAMMTTRPATERVEWEAPLRRGEVDRCGLGVIDERAKQFSPAERRIAEYLAVKGPAVVSISEGFGVCGRTADARVDGTQVEFKTVDPGAGDQTVKAALNSAKGQARYAVIDARDSRLTEDDAQRGIRRFSGTPYGDRLDAVLIIGDDYIIDWKRAS
jgi:Contact-dependent growth inhibition CdiA C-terminal domain